VMAAALFQGTVQLHSDSITRDDFDYLN